MLSHSSHEIFTRCVIDVRVKGAIQIFSLHQSFPARGASVHVPSSSASRWADLELSIVQHQTHESVLVRARAAAQTGPLRTV